MTIPSNLRIPFVAVEFDPTRAQQGPALLAYRALIIGQKITAGTGAANSLHRVTSADAVATLAGRGSMLHRQAKAWFANNAFTETWIGILDDNGAGTAATKTITVTGPATAAGTIHLRVAGDYVPVAVASGDAASAIATAINAAINAATDLPCTSTVVDAVATAAYRHKGAVGTDLDIRVNYQLGEALPAGVGVAVAAGVAGAANPVLTTLIAALGDTWYNVIAHPFTDATSLTALEAELASRTGSTRMIDGVAITSAAGTQGTLSTLGDTRNSSHNCIVAQGGKLPLTQPCEYAAAVAAVVALEAAADPARPFQTLALAGVLPPADADHFTKTERNLLLFDGIATSIVAAGGICQIERLITTYKTNAAGSADTAYLDATTLFSLMYARYDWRVRIQTKYPRHKLASDGARVAPGQAIMTPSLMRAEAVGWFLDLADKGIFDGGKLDQFKADLTVAVNGSDPNRLDVLLPPDLINQLIVTATTVQFRQ